MLVPEPCHDVFDPCASRFAEPTTVLPAVGTAQFTRVRLLAGADDADVAAARPLAINETVEPYLEANNGEPAGGRVSLLTRLAGRAGSR